MINEYQKFGRSKFYFGDQIDDKKFALVLTTSILPQKYGSFEFIEAYLLSLDLVRTMASMTMLELDDYVLLDYF